MTVLAGTDQDTELDGGRHDARTVSFLLMSSPPQQRGREREEGGIYISDVF